MNQQRDLRAKYIQLVEAFINALETGKPGEELEALRNEIRNVSSLLELNNNVENDAQLNKSVQAFRAS